ncbi:uncharacterized protein L3040_008380 [Drepanopeziza brunnea f. sp. 'multigermtubi']|uniref:uncharacterized protein n=1 Tax=Drepanopeziza brunnea f. sp. 'multigermtubi' TaxID=698441 RepID=UPI00239D32F1|nr:hypothetical protein L3040_008380 [Drepanopeziza brunnea f. sp. 'multigermtubi']
MTPAHPTNMLEDSSSQLCKPCYQLKGRILGPKKPEKGPKLENEYILHANYQQLSDCVACPLCQFIRRELLYIKERDGHYRFANASSFSREAVISALVNWGVKIFQHRERYADFKIRVEGEDALKYDDPVVDDRGIETGQREILRPGNFNDRVRSWMESCLGQHPNCAKAEDQFRPTRLLDLAAGDGGNEIRLILSDRFMSKVRTRLDHYATLSYCWGPPGLNATTTPDNLEARQRGIPLEDLPKTVRDAVQVCRELSIRFLWVDALCIIQGDGDDWDRESAFMGQIYRRSLCTIAACLGDDCTVGLFGRREAARLPACQVKCADKGNAGRFFKLAPQIDHWYTSVELSTLSTRGWVMQERLLAVRTIFFTEEGVFWQCSEGSSSEFMDNVETNWADRFTPQPAKPRFVDLVRDWRADAQEFDFKPTGKITTDTIPFFAWKHTRSRKVEARPWHNLVYEFTRRNLSQPRDRLSAVQGIANEFAASTNDVYVDNAGVWKSDILGGIAWYRHWEQASAPLAIAPSWSWASTTGAIVSMYNRTQHVVNIAAVNWAKTSPLKTSRHQRSISISELHIKGYAFLIKTYPPHPGSDSRIFSAVDSSSSSSSASAPPPPPPQPKGLRKFFNPKPDFDRLSGIKSASGMGRTLGWSGPASKVRKDHGEVIFDSSAMNPQAGTEFLCMPIVGVGMKAPSPQVFPAGLVLVVVDDAARRKVYRRVGWCFLWAAIPDERVTEVEVVVI